MKTGVNWRFLIVEDKQDIVRQLCEVIPHCVDENDTVEIVKCGRFAEAEPFLRQQNFDILILDLKDDGDDSLGEDVELAGLKIFDLLTKTRFAPVVFYTAFAYKITSLETTFVRVVNKADGVMKVKEEVIRVIKTRLPSLTRKIEEVQRSYMWDFVRSHWKEFSNPADQADIAYLLARRLAIALEGIAGDLAAQVGGLSDKTTSTAKSHPMAMYVVPPIGKHSLAGDIVLEKGAEESYWLILTPSCDFAQSKADHCTLAKCERLVDLPDYKAWQSNKSAKNLQKVERLIQDNRGDRFKFLPRAFFLPDLVVDFQQLRTFSVGAAAPKFDTIASLDSPFAESVAARFSRYFNRLGTPDIDQALILSRLTVSAVPLSMSQVEPQG